MVDLESGLLLFLLMLNFGNTEDLENCQKCTFDSTTGILKCSDINIVHSNAVIDLNCTVPDEQKHQVDYLIIENSTIHTLNLRFIDENKLFWLSGISIHEANITNVVGRIPCHLLKLQLSNNLIRNFRAVILSRGYERDIIEVDPEKESVDRAETDGSQNHTTKPHQLKTVPCVERDFLLDLSDNMLEELPVTVVESRRFKALHLAGNPLKCEFIWETVWDHLKCQHRSQECINLFVDQNSTTCQFYRQKLVPSGIFYYNLAQIFSSKITLEDECLKIDTICECHPFNLLRGEGGNPTVYLSVNCAGKNLTQLPKISEYSWELNISSNEIQDLTGLNSLMYRNLRRIDLSRNYVDDLNELTNSGFMKKFDLLYINANPFRKIPDNFFSAAKNSEGKAMLKLGSHLECNCQTATETKGRIIEMQNNILDFNDVECWNKARKISYEDASSTGGNYLRLKDLRLTDVCPLNPGENGDFNWMLVVIICEVACILGVILKVFYDWRKYQQTGILPWIAEKLPQLPCDGILE